MDLKTVYFDDKKAFIDSSTDMAVEIYNDEDVSVYFCGIQADTEKIQFKIWCDSHRDDDTNLYVRSMYIDDVEYLQFHHFYTLGAWQDGLGYFTIFYKDLEQKKSQTVEFFLEIDDEDHDYLGESDSVRLICEDVRDSFPKSFAVQISETAKERQQAYLNKLSENSQTEQLKEEIQTHIEGESFQEILLYDDDDVVIELSDITIIDDIMTVKLWIDSNRDDHTEFLIKTLEYNGNEISEFDTIQELECWESKYAYIKVPYENTSTQMIHELSFALEIDDEDEDILGETEKIFITYETERKVYSIKYKNTNKIEY